MPFIEIGPSQCFSFKKVLNENGEEALYAKAIINFCFLSDDCHSCLPCGHIFGMSCILNWLRKFTHAHEDTRRFPYSKQGYTSFKQYIRGRLTHALNKRSDALKQRANVLGWQNAAMKWWTNLLNRKEYAERRAKALERRANAIRRADALRWAGAL
ncbi:hypothetical protein Tco_0681868 [Tanacetum coccineum]|uniref:RING-type domain-containing protein n=1 Tax=Tanacetum coccineum TaxID=301880 RepID=A0ABQ4XPU1_9ASTR